MASINTKCLPWFFRHYCFLTCKKDFEDKVELDAHCEEQTTRIYALILQATLGDYERSSFLRHSSRLNWPAEFSHAVAVQHAKLAGMKASSAEYNCLKEFLSLEDFGYEYHSVRTDDNTIHTVGVGREGLRFCDETGAVIRRYLSSNMFLCFSFKRLSFKKHLGCQKYHRSLMWFSAWRTILNGKNTYVAQIKNTLHIFTNIFDFRASARAPSSMQE